eukprot:Blabericola_migrator_1__1750@NODE_1471_length_4495_cov_63_310298_g968_i0_p2_GENE_NODE_1471_length_4495_cov_63_310298_g968_i0NODE_1471_length_4495_cov_63_310298_g968_i0_p2_ORF_typecomplete_len436_score37_56SET/PF00856_28/9_7e09SET/PF00856_28/1_5e03TPR_MalT/PF17874_1/0_062_NODE_1471_length_4495_cov_63_310298_g968_i061313
MKINAGEVILVEPALLMVDAVEEHRGCEPPEPENPTTMTRFMQALYGSVLESSFMREALTDLYSGEVASPLTEEDEIDCERTSDILTWLSAICHYNLFRVEPEFCRRTTQEFEKLGCRWGLYHNGSMFNHSCLESATRGFIGSTLVVIAKTNLQPGTEITLTYCCPKLSYRQRQRTFDAKNFRCTCSLCLAESQMSEAAHVQRERDLHKLTEFINKLRESSVLAHEWDESFEALRLLERSLGEYWSEVTSLHRLLNPHAIALVDPVSPMLSWAWGAYYERKNKMDIVLELADKAFQHLVALCDYTDACQVALDLARRYFNQNHMEDAARWIKNAIFAYAAPALGFLPPTTDAIDDLTEAALDPTPDNAFQPQVVANMERILICESNRYRRRQQSMEWSKKAVTFFCLCEPALATRVREMIMVIGPTAMLQAGMWG